MQSPRRNYNDSFQSRSVFRGILGLLREYVGPVALQTAYKQMQLSMYYRTEVIQPPHLS